MFLDVVVIFLLVLALIKGIQKGFIVGVFSLLAFIIGLAAALKLSAVVAAYLGENVSVSKQWLPFLAFALVFFVVVLVVRLGAKALEGAARLLLLGWLNKLGGILLFTLLYLFILSILLFYAEGLALIKPTATDTSVTYPFLQALGPKLIAALSFIVPAFKNMFEELNNFFGSVAAKS